MSIVLFAMIGAAIKAGVAYWICYGVYCTIGYSGWVTVVVSGIIMVIMIIVFACNYIGVNAQVEKTKNNTMPSHIK